MTEKAPSPEKSPIEAASEALAVLEDREKADSLEGSVWLQRTKDSMGFLAKGFTGLLGGAIWLALKITERSANILQGVAENWDKAEKIPGVVFNEIFKIGKKDKK